MKLMKLSILSLTCAIIAGAMGCSSDPRANLPKVERQEEKDDGSTVVVSASSNGTRTEARTFPSGDVARVTRITTPNGHRRAIAEFRDTTTVEIKDGNEVDRVIEATADAVKSAAVKARDGVNSAGAEAADKTEDAADKAADVGKDVGSKAKRGAEEAGDAASDAASAAKKGVKKTGKGIKKVGQKIKDSVTP
jgi:hypothetical protein